MANRTLRIDIHHHALPKKYLALLRRRGITKAAGVSFPRWEVERSVRLMNRLSIKCAVISISAPGVYFGDTREAQILARTCNEFMGHLIETYPQRFGGFAVLPLPDLEAALEELEYALDQLQLDGVSLLTNINGKFLGDSLFTDLFAELNRRQSVVFVHPNTSPAEMLPEIKAPPAIMEFVFNTTRAIANLIYTRTFQKYSKIRFIFAHSGGTLPFIAWRITMGDAHMMNILKTLYYDIALSATAFALPSLKALADPAHILFGSDYPFLPEPLITANINGLNSYQGFNSETRRAIERENALKLFPRLR
ncbi:MAG: amidohydrolase family protein [Candidatus Helarchaeota archaeon]